MSKKLVTYFSASGVTGKVANNLAAAADADLFEIAPETPYTSADLNWRDENARSTVEMKDKSSRPKLAENSVNIADYDVVFVGFFFGVRCTIVRRVSIHKAVGHD